MLQVATVLLFAVLTSAQPERPSYEMAYKRAQEENKPLLVVVGADWCAACQTLKSETIEPMESNGKLGEVVLTIVDKDARPELAQQLMQGPTLPQLLVFSKSEGGWKKFSLVGIQTEGRVKELIEKASEGTHVSPSDSSPSTLQSSVDNGPMLHR
jgi:thioredoxin-like negative regulator of GroEL